MSDNFDIGLIYNEYVDDLYIYALHLGFEQSHILDAIHDVFCKLCTDQESIKHINNIKQYLLKSLKNRLIDIYNSNKNNVKKDINEIPEFDNSFLQQRNSVEDCFITLEDEKIINEMIDGMLEELTNRQRQIIYLRYVVGCDYDEIAERMSLNYASCRKLVHKAMDKLRKKYNLSDLQIILLLCLARFT
jgi:RNA polymerase sigma factor (sigma-70 family)